MIQRVSAEDPEKNAHSENCAAAGAAVDSENVPIDPDLRAIMERWGQLPDAVKAGIVAIVRAAE
jgi:hypothetical protein